VRRAARWVGFRPARDAARAVEAVEVAIGQLDTLLAQVVVDLDLVALVPGVWQAWPVETHRASSYGCGCLSR
jgi:hypothetical protein